MAQFGGAPDLGSGGREFESRHSKFRKNVIVFLVRIDRGCYNNISGVDYA